ncbi:MAG TPA: GNAT family N-acetyltransferase [Candidatus Polarisedimenticolia bacterium]|nr:GNAT family N-acetyltransferase [Candidatus Polarisedimenticolia bacterium]
MITRDATGAEIDQVLAGTHALWSDGLDREAYAGYVRTMMASDWARAGGYRFLVLDGGGRRVLSALKLYRLAARLDGCQVAVGGVGAVFTPPELRGRGHASALLDGAHAIMAARGDRAALLYSEIGAGYYARLGYRPMRPRSSALPVPPEGGLPRGLHRMHRTELPAVMALREREDRGLPFALTRDEGYWRLLLARASYPTLHLGPERWESRVVLDGRRGYLWSLLREPSAQLKHDGGAAARILELGEETPGCSAPLLLDELFSECRRRGIATVEAWLPADAPARDPRLAGKESEPSVVPMWRPAAGPPSQPPDEVLHRMPLHLSDVF